MSRTEARSQNPAEVNLGLTSGANTFEAFVPTNPSRKQMGEARTTVVTALLKSFGERKSQIVLNEDVQVFDKNYPQRLQMLRELSAILRTCRRMHVPSKAELQEDAEEDDAGRRIYRTRLVISVTAPIKPEK